jgi:NitT/TauT family transport system permease protein
MLSVWELLSLIFPPAFIPSPIRVGEVMVQNFYIPRGPGLHTALYHIGRSMERIAIGFLLSMLVGGMIGIAIGINRHADTMLSQWVAVGLTIPSLFWALIAVMWFRISETTAIFTILAVSFPYVSVQMAAAVKNANKNLVDMARVFGSSRSLMIRKVFIPQLMPNIFSAGRSAFAMSWKVCTIAELFGLSDGVGFMLNYWFGEFRIEQVMAWILAFVLIMLAIENFVLVRLEKRVLRWRPEVVV